jgi:hypothetical protein
MQRMRGWAVVLGLFATVLAPAAHAGAQIEVADRCPLPLRVRTASPIGIGGCSGVRPGAYYSSPTTGCTFNFLFRGRDGYRYIGSAGHCLVETNEVASWPIGAGPEIRSDTGAVVGRGAYAINRGERDFALIRLDPGTKANPQMCHFGGPTGIDDSHSAPATIEHYGQGIGVSIVTPGRTAIATDMRGEDSVTAVGVANFGDSGSGTTHDGRALGVLVALVVGTTAGNIHITRLIPQLAEAEEAIGTDLTLVTAPRL